jgi:hypothetical protein
MRRLAALAACAAALAACGPVATVNNPTSSLVRVSVNGPEGFSTFRLAPKDSRAIGSSAGRYAVVVVGIEWDRELARQRRKVETQLADPRGLTPSDVADLRRWLRDLDAMQSGFGSASCVLTLKGEDDAAATVTADAQQRIGLACR